MSTITHAYEMAVFAGAINRVGVEDGVKYYGTTMIVNPYGETLAQGSQDKDEVVSSVVDLSQVGRTGMSLRDFRPELYESITRPPRG